MDLRQTVTAAGDYYLKGALRTTQLPSFEYDALEPDHIRVLTLLPGQELDPICCEFQIVLRNAAASNFSALSYWWGLEPRDLEAILINKVVMGDTVVTGDRRLPVWPNLYNALVALRRGSQEPLHLWIDAICINQTCALEKTEQIRHMDQIYTSASNVIIWLGEAGDSSDHVMDSISSKLTGDYTTPWFMLGIIAILARPWFTRTWIVQEFVLNRASPLMACGFKRMITWDDFMEAYTAAFPQAVQSSALERLPPQHCAAMMPLLDRWLQYHPVYTMLKSFRIGVQSGRSDLATYALRYAIRATRSFHATDPRDKIYGILALTHKETQERIDAIYSKSVEDVFRDATIHMLQVEKSAAVYVSVPLGRSTRPTLPSWVPDFAVSKAPRDIEIGQIMDSEAMPRHRAEDVRLSDCKKKLIVKGLFLDAVQTVLRVTASGQSQLAYLIELSQSLTDIERLVSRCAERLGNSRPIEPLWKILLFSQSERDEFQNEEECQTKFGYIMAGVKELTATEHGLLFFFEHMKAATPLSSQIMAALSRQGRSFFAGYDGWYGFGEGDMKDGDQLALLFPDANVPFILRKKGDCFEMVGVARLPGGMRSAAATSRASEFRDITID